MASVTTDIKISNATHGVVSRIWTALIGSVEDHAANRRRQIEALEAKSDAELKKLGVRREDIPHYVFRDLYYA